MQLKEYVPRYQLKNTIVAHVAVKQPKMIVIPKDNDSFPENANVFALILKQNQLARIKNIIGTKHPALAFACQGLNGELAILDTHLILQLIPVLVSQSQKQPHLYWKY